MVNTFPVTAIAGAVFGFLSGIGVGGGSLLMVWLTMIVGLEPYTARCINLMVFIPCALCASLLRLKQGGLPGKKITAPMILGAAVAGIVAYFSAGLDTQWLKKIFALLLLYTGVRELLYKPKE
jgi:uncharacterized membrane protein YfcA